MENESASDLSYVLSMCAGIEKVRGETYDHLAHSYRFDEEISALFRKTANEERNHEQQFLFALRKFPAVITCTTVSPGQVKIFAERAQNYLQLIKSRVPGIAEALSMAVRWEEEFRRFHMDAGVTFEDPALKNLFVAMMAADEDHIRSLRKALSLYLEKNK